MAEWDIPDDEEFEDAAKGGAGDYPVPGEYHAQVVEAEEYDDHAIWRWEVMTPGSEQGKTVRHRIQFTSQKSEAAMKTCMRISKATAIASRLVTKEMFEAAKRDGRRLSVDFGATAIGCQAIVKVAAGKPYTDSQTGEEREGRPEVASVFDLADPKKVGVRLNVEMAAMLGVRRDIWEDDPFGNPSSPAAGAGAEKGNGTTGAQQGQPAQPASIADEI